MSMLTDYIKGWESTFDLINAGVKNMASAEYGRIRIIKIL